MKIEKVSLKGHPFFGDKEIEFKDAKGNILDTVVFAGVNGSGKTTILETIFHLLTNANEVHEHENSIRLNIQMLIDSGLLKKTAEMENWFAYARSLHFAIYFGGIDDGKRPKIIYMPAGIEFKIFEVSERSYEYKYSHANIIDTTTAGDIPTYISSLIKDEIFKNIKLPAEIAIKKVCREINSIFDDLEIDAEMTGLAEDGEKLPVFKNKGGCEFNINGLSSGEKQLFVRTLSLKMIRANNSIILIDEPEISLHPKWQQRILNVYRKMGKNNQVIVATHSPHVVSSLPTENLFLLSMENGESEIFNYREKNSVHGKPIEIVLKDFMGLKSDRDPDTAELIEEVRDLVRSSKYESDPFKQKFEILRNRIGEIDQDIILLKMDIAKRKAVQGGGRC